MKGLFKIIGLQYLAAFLITITLHNCHDVTPPKADSLPSYWRKKKEDTSYSWWTRARESKEHKKALKDLR